MFHSRRAVAGFSNFGFDFQSIDCSRSCKGTLFRPVTVNYDPMTLNLKYDLRRVKANQHAKNIYLKNHFIQKLLFRHTDAPDQSVG